jgi:glycosyltransferase involved in cell wall biosynthesis
MFRLNNPSWINQDLFARRNPNEFTEQNYAEINSRLEAFAHSSPVVSVVIAAYNEEATILRCIDSISKSNSKYQFEIVLVDNNSKDRTAEIAKKLKLNYFFEPRQGCGFARQTGQENAAGKYILTADADTLYPPDWINELMRQLQKPGVVCVYGRYSFLGDATTPRWKLTIYETLSDVMSMIKSYKRPFLSVYGMSMGYVREFGLKAGYVQANIRGEDGRLAFDLMKFGKIKSVMTNKARVWTITRTISQDGKLSNALKNRMIMALASLGSLMKKADDHDTKTSENQTADYNENMKAIKRKIGIEK